MKLIIGLGNPGDKYKNTRHNLGFMVIEKIAKEFEIENFRDKFQAKIADFIYRDEKVILLMPQTYMNLSGNSLIEAIKFYKIDSKTEILVIYDDMDLSFEKIKIKKKGSAGGHNGIKSIISHIGEEFLRLKCGIGKPEDKSKVINYVLEEFYKEEKEKLSEYIERLSKISLSLISAKNVDKVISKYN